MRFPHSVPISRYDAERKGEAQRNRPTYGLFVWPGISRTEGIGSVALSDLLGESSHATGELGINPCATHPQRPTTLEA